MLYYLFNFLENRYDVPGGQLFQYITFRASMAIIFSLAISTIFGKRIINYLRVKQVGETVRELGLEGQEEKEGTPTMGGLIIILATLIPVLLFAKLENIYVILLIVTTLWMGGIGFLDDYIKIFRKNKDGLKGKFKVVGQVGLGIIVGVTMYFHPDITIREKQHSQIVPVASQTELVFTSSYGEAHKSTKTTIPFFKKNEFEYSSLITWINPALAKYA